MSGSGLSLEMDGISVMVALATPTYAEASNLVSARNQSLELTHRIDSRTFRQVRNLHVVHDADKVVLHGRSESYYVKQLATHAVLDLMPGVSVENRIDVNR